MKISRWTRFKDWLIYPGRCKYWRVCPDYIEPSHTCNQNEGYYGESLASCYVKMTMRIRGKDGKKLV